MSNRISSSRTSGAAWSRPSGGSRSVAVQSSGVSTRSVPYDEVQVSAAAAARVEGVVAAPSAIETSREAYAVAEKVREDLERDPAAARVAHAMAPHHVTRLL